jgi:hypothetical protein
MLRLGRSAMPSRTPPQRLDEFVRQISHDQLPHGLSSKRNRIDITDITQTSAWKADRAVTKPKPAGPVASFMRSDGRP